MTLENLYTSNSPTDNYSNNAGKPTDLDVFIEKYYFFICLVIILLAVFIRHIGLDKGIWMDEREAIFIAESEYFVEALKMNDYPPAYFILLRLWTGINTNEVHLRQLSLVMGVSTVVIMMVWLRDFSKHASLLGGFLTATAPFLIQYSQEIQVYPLLILSTACAMLFTYKIISSDNNKLWYALLAITLSIAVSTHMVGIMLIAGIGFCLLPFLLKCKKMVDWVLSGLVLMVPSVIFLFSYFYFAGGGKEGTWWMPPLSLGLIIRHYSSLFGMDYLISLRHLLVEISLWLGPVYLGSLVLVVVMIGLLITVFGNWRRSWQVLSVAVVIWLQIIIFSILFIPIFYHRILSPGLIPFIGFLSIQVTSINKNLIRRLAVLGLVVLFSGSTAVWMFTSANEPHEEWNHAGAYMESVYQEGDLVAICPYFIENSLRYYFPSLVDSDVVTLEIESFPRYQFQPFMSDEAIYIQLDNAPEALDMALRDRIVNKDLSKVKLYLVVRPAYLEHEQVHFEKLLAYLDETSVHVYPRLDFKGLYILQYDVNPFTEY